MIRRARWSQLLGACSLVIGCGAANVNSGEVFTTTWQDDGGKSIALVEQQLHALPLNANARLAVGVTETGLVGVTLNGAGHWTYSGRIQSMPAIAGKLVIVSAGDRIVALDANSGGPVWSIANRGLGLRGAANDGTSTALVLADARRSLFLAVSSSGAALGSVATDTPLGLPAARGGIAFVPWSNEYVSALDMSNGDERGRLLTREQVSRAANFGGYLYFGEHGLLRFDDKIRFASTNQATRIGLPRLDLPGKPSWLDSGMQNAGTEVDARTKIRIYAAPTESSAGALTLGAGSFAASYFRALLGLDSQTGALVWVRSFPADIVGGAAASAGFVVCDETGKVRLLDSAGNDSETLDLGAKIRACVVDTGAEPIATGAPRASLAVQITDALTDLDPNMAEAERYLLVELGKQAEPLVTKTLIDVASSPRIPPDLRTQARRLLALRTNGTDYMLTALTRHYDFVTGVLLPPPVGPLADALATMGETRAAPLLAKHLNDPANSEEDVAHAARALLKLATKAEYEDLRTFFALYRATADDDALVGAVIASAQALLRVGGDAAHSVVLRAAADSLTQSDVRRALPELLLKAENTQGGARADRTEANGSQTRSAPPKKEAQAGAR